MEEIKIEKGIPISPWTKSTGMTATMRKMKIGDSFVFDKKYRSGIPSIASRIGMKMATRKINDTQIRVWRVK